MSEAMDYKLPPLPSPGEALSKWAYDEHDMQAYAIAAIEAQGVSDANAEFNRAIDFAIEQGIEAAVFLRCWREGDTSEWPEFTPMLASAPPAPQADKYVPCPHCGKNTANDNPSQWCPCPKQASVVQQEPAAWKHDCAALLTNDVELWIDACPHCGKPRIQPAQQGPVAWIRPSGKAMLEAGGYCTVYASDGMSNHSTPLYTHPAPQAKPQP